MDNKKLNVAVLYGGISPEHMISRASANNIISGLSSEKYNIVPIYINKEGAWLMYENYKDSLKDFAWEKIESQVSLSVNHDFHGMIRFIKEKAKLIDIDVIFPVLHGANGEDGTIQGLFEIARVPYVGCGVLASSIAMDKNYMRIVAEHSGIAQTKYICVSDLDYKNKTSEILKSVKSKLNYPCFIKPCSGGSSIGMTKAKDKKELISGIELALHYDRKVLIEKFISGREFECSVLGSATDNDINISGVGELKYQSEYYSYDGKYMDASSETIIPTNLAPELVDQIKNISHKIFSAFDCSGLARIDFFVEHDTNKIIFNELNTMPGFTNISMYPKLWEHENISLEILLDKLIEIALGRQKIKDDKIWTIEQ